MSKLSTTTKGAATPNRATTHPGEVLKSMFSQGIQTTMIVMGLNLVKSFFKICDRIHYGELMADIRRLLPCFHF